MISGDGQVAEITCDGGAAIAHATVERAANDKPPFPVVSGVLFGLFLVLPFWALVAWMIL